MERWYELKKEDILKMLEVSPEKGLPQELVTEKQVKYGKNELIAQKKDGISKTIFNQLKDFSTIVLMAAAVLSFLLALRHQEGFIEPIVIISIVIMNIILAVTQEGKAERALEALAGLNSPTCVVLRDGSWQVINTVEVVPGDIIQLEAGSFIPADARLLESTSLFIDESALTGESEPSEKNAQVELTGKVPIGDQINMVFSSCLVTAGRGTAVVTATCMDTQMGLIAGFLNDTKKSKTPLQIRLDRVGKTISGIAIVSAIFLFIVGMIQGEDFWTMMLLAVSLAVAAVPETLSLIVTLSLSNGVKKMVKKNTLIRKLPAVETLGNTSIICSDKTGTLTQNKMSIKRLWIEGLEPFKDSDEFSEKQITFLKMMAMASNATIETESDGSFKFIGNPTEIAIMRLLNDKGIKKSSIEAEYAKVAEIPFSSERKMMTTILKNPDGKYIVLCKGAIDRLPLINSESEILEIHDSFAKDALRVIALGIRYIDELPPESDYEKLESNLQLLGIIGIIDPPRPEAIKAIETAKEAGIRSIMITGDHSATAGAIARDMGILIGDQKILTGTQLEEISDDDLHNEIQDYSVYARVSPEDKIRIVKAWQKKGEIVSMTGDGVNDAPALKAADVGIAMGKAGTEVAKNAADIVLTDDNFATIIEAVYEGRNVYANIRRVIYFLLVCNLSEIIIVLFSQLIGWGIVVTPVMLLLINVLGDGIPGLHLAKETSDPRIMSNGPISRNESFFSKGLLKVIIYQTIICSVVVLGGYYIGAFINFDPKIVPSHLVGQTLAFIILGLTSILHIFTVRSRKSIFKNTLRNNWSLVISSVAMIAVIILLAAVPSIGKLLGLTDIGSYHWIVIIILTIIPTIVAEIGKYIDNNLIFDKT